MFQEIDQSLIKPPQPTFNKRWFRDIETECDLFVWERPDGEIERFQFWYQEALVEWNRDVRIKTGHVDPNTGAFVHYQSETYQLHENSDREILELVKSLLEHQDIDQTPTLVLIKNILLEITISNEGKKKKS